MDLIYTDSNKKELGVLKGFSVDFDTSDKKDYELVVGINNNVLVAKGYWYINGTEYGGKVDSLEVNTDTQEIKYKGRNYRGILCEKIIEPPTGQDHKIMSGNLQTITQALINEAGLAGLYVADKSPIDVSEHKFNRYITTYEGILSLGYRYNVIPRFKVVDGLCHIQSV